MSLFSRQSSAKVCAVTCPLCAHKQEEPFLAVSTNCRSCRVNFDIIEGVPVKPKLLGHIGIPVRPPVRSSPAAKREETNTGKSFESDSFGPVTAPTPVVGRKRNDSVKRREVACFTCEAVHKASLDATSTLCPKCGSYIGLKNYDIREKWNRQIKTRGDVVIQKKGRVVGVSVQCNNLTVHGDITGGVDCSGDFTVTRHGKILGRVRCKRLVIAKKAEVEFINQVYCDEVVIDGKATGNLICKGKVLLAAKAKLIGDLVASSLAIAEGARHQGGIQTYKSATYPDAP